MPISLTLKFPRVIPAATSAVLARSPHFVEAMHHDPATGRAYAALSDGSLWVFARGADTAWALAETFAIDGRLSGSAPTEIAPGTVLVWGRDGLLEHVDPATGDRVHFVGHTDHVRSAAERAQRVISGGDDAQLRIWDAATGHLEFEAPPAKSAIGAVAFLTDHLALVVIAGRHIEVWDLEEQACLAKVATRLTPQGVVVDPGGRWFAAWGSARVEVFNARTHARVHNIKPRLGKLTCLTVRTGGLLTGSETGHWACLDPASGAVLRKGHAHAQALHGVMGLPGKVLSWSLDGSVSVSDLGTGGVVARHADHTNMVACGAIVDGGVLTGSADGTVRFWTAQGGSIASLTAAGHTTLVRQAGFIDDAHVLTVASDGVRVWDLETGAVEGYRDQPDSGCAVVDAERVYAGAQSNLVQIWDRRTGATVRRFGYAGARFAIGQPGGGLVVTGVGPDLIAHHTEAPWGTPWQVRAFQTNVMRVAIAPDGRLGIARDESNGAVIFDPRTGALGQRLEDAKVMRWLDDRRVLIDDGERCVLWTGDAATLMGKITELPASVTTATVIVDGATLGATRDARLVTWDDAWAATALDLPAANALDAIDGRLIAVGEGGTCIVTLKAGVVTAHPVGESTDQLILHPDHDDVWVVLQDKTFAVWIAGEARVHGVSERPGGYDWAISIEDAVFSGEVLLVGTGQGDVEVWRWRSGTREAIHRSLDSTVAFRRTPCGNIAAASLDSRMAVYGPDGALLTTYGGHGSMVMAVLLYAPVDGPQLLVSAGFDGLIIGWDVAGDCRRWTIRTGDVHGIAMLGPHHLVVGTQEGEAEVWDLRDQERVASVPMGGIVRSTLPALHAPQVASVSKTGRVVVWGIDDGAVEVLSDTHLGEAAGEMRSAAWHPTEATLAVLQGNTLKTLRGEVIETSVRWGGASAQTVTWSGDGSLLFIGDYAGGVFAMPADHDGDHEPEILVRTPDTVMRMHARGDQLLIGDASGAVRVYRVNR